jgi:hypothetical protein
MQQRLFTGQVSRTAAPTRRLTSRPHQAAELRSAFTHWNERVRIYSANLEELAMKEFLAAAQSSSASDGRLEVAFIGAFAILVVGLLNYFAQRRLVNQQGKLLDRQLRESRQQHQRTIWLDASSQLSSKQAAVRAVGMAAAIEYLHDQQLRQPALRVALNALHYENDPLIVYRGLQALSDPSLLEPAIKELLIINRQVWRDLLEEFARTCLEQQHPGTRPKLETHIKQLKNNQRLASYLLQQGNPEGLDFSNTFYPDLRAPARSFTKCDFSSSLLHYSNFHHAVFDDCIFTRSVLIGSYLEEARFANCSSWEGVVALGARFHRGGRDEVHGDERELPSELERWSASTAPSFMMEAEQDWHGHWLEQDGTTRREFTAQWYNPAGGSEKATIVLEENGTFERTASRNNGTYKTTCTEILDSVRGVALVGGTRTLRSGIPSVWWAIWWDEHGALPIQVIPVSDTVERPPGH